MKRGERTTLFSLPQLLFLWAAITITWALYRATFRLPELVEEGLIKPVVFLLPLVVVAAHKKKLRPEIFGLRMQGWRKILIWGGGFGLLLTVENAVVWKLKGYGWDLGDLSVNRILEVGIVSWMTAVSEEILYRGVMLQELWRLTGKEHLANVITAILFGFGHLGVGVLTLHYGSTELFAYLLLIVVIGFAQGFVFARTRSVWAAIITHALWNATNTFIH